MTCKIARPTPAALFERVSNMFSTTVLAGGAIIPESNEYYAVALNYAMSEEFYSLSEQQWRERDPRYACCDNLVEIAAKEGVYPRPAGFAQGYVRITGTPGAALSQNIQVRFGDQVYSAASTVPGEMGDSGELVIRMAAVAPGPTGNQPSTATGTVISPPTGINAEAIVFGGQFCGGTDAEQCEQFRTRYLNRKKFQPKRDAQWIKDKILEWPCVTDVCDRGGECCVIAPEDWNKVVDCKAQVEVYAIFEGTFDCGLAPACVTDEITTWIFGEVQGRGEGEAPWGMTGKVYTATAGYVSILVDGAACSTPALMGEIEDRIRDFARKVCPSQPLQVADLEMIVRQLLGLPSEQFGVVINVDPGYETVLVKNYCGDVTPICDYKVCVSNISFANPQVNQQGTCA